MGEVIQYGLPKLPAPIFRIWLIRSSSLLAAVCLSFVYRITSDIPAASSAVVLLAILLVVVAVVQTYQERRIVRLARQNDLKLCATCCTPFDPESVERCSSCGIVIDAREEQRRWRRAVLISLWNWFGPKPRGARIFPHWSIPLLVGIFWFGYLFLRGSIEDWFWPSNTQTTHTFTLPNSGNPPKTYQIPIPTHPPTSYIIVMSAIGMLIMLGMFTFILVRTYRVSKLLKYAAKNGFLVCDRCTYPLTDTDDNKCPECGRAFEREKLRQSWYIPFGLYVQRQAFNMSIPLGLEADTNQSSKA